MGCGQFTLSGVPTLHRFPKHEVPREIAVQIRSFIRIQWPALMGRGGRLYDVEPCDAMTFVLMEDEALVSHAQVKRWDFPHDGEMLKVAGLSAVFTYPAWRGSGCGKQIIRAATDYLPQTGADIGMLFCSDGRRMLYESCGWIVVRSTRVLEGDEHSPKVHENQQMAFEITPKGRQIRESFENAAVYVGQSTW
jgi:GNAT superfamily N-acetyltransferase